MNFQFAKQQFNIRKVHYRHLVGRVAAFTAVGAVMAAWTLAVMFEP